MTYTILIVDDSKLARMAATKALKALEPDWTRLEAAGFDEALGIANATLPDIALLDFNMPGKSGLELAEELQRRKPGMPIALISANQQQEVIDRASALKAFFLAKPLTEAAMKGFLTAARQQIEQAQR